MVQVPELQLSPNGIRGAVATPHIRQILIVPRSTLDLFMLEPGLLRENVVIDDHALGDLHDMPSGTVLEIGGAQIRLTVHCEPCPRVADCVRPYSRLEHRRGYLGTCLNDATITVGQQVRSLGVKFEAIPFDLKDRASWYLAKCESPVRVTEFVQAMGLSIAYCRAVPNLIRDIAGGSNKVLFGGSRRRNGAGTHGKVAKG